jgi:hypothetical protein
MDDDGSDDVVDGLTRRLKIRMSRFKISKVAADTYVAQLDLAILQAELFQPAVLAMICVFRRRRRRRQ